MNLWKVCACSLALFLNPGFLFAETPATLRFRVLPLGDSGVIGDLAPKEWKVTLGGREAKLLSQRLPKELGLESQKWVFILLPVRDPEYRRMVVQAIGTFMSTLPASDSVLVVARSAKGMECFTPGFTTRPSLWERALVRVIEELPARLEGKSASEFSLPASPVAEKEEGMEPIQAFLAGLSDRKMEKMTADAASQGSSVMDSYSVDSLGSIASTVVAHLNSLGLFLESIAKTGGEKQVVIFSRNEMDDLANPVWKKNVSRLSADRVANSRLQVEMMIRDVTLAQMSFNAKLDQSGLTLHSVAKLGGSYAGAFGNAAQSTGGFQFRLDNELVPRFSQLLPLWAARYELEVLMPAGVARPAKLAVETERKNIRMYAPAAQ